MQRELKFKVWSKELNAMYWFDLMWGRNGRSGSGWISALPFGEERSTGFFNRDNTIDLSPDECVFLQFTGLTDKNGEEIYEGDIIKYFIEDYVTPAIIPVKYHAPSFGIPTEDDERFNRDEGIEVIGNIYENSELLAASITAP